MQNLTARGQPGTGGERGREDAAAATAGRAGASTARRHAQLDHQRCIQCCCYRGRASSDATTRENETSGPEEKTTATTRNMQSHQLHGSEPVRAAGRKKQKRSADPSGHEEPDGGGGDEPPRRNRNTKAAQTSTTSAIRGLLRDFFEQQLRLDAQRQEMMERHAQERLFFEEQWRQSMRRMEQERLMLEQAWMEREEQRRMREEDRAERRDALLTSLLTRLL